MLLRKKNGLNFTPQDFFDSHVCNAQSHQRGRRVYILTITGKMNMCKKWVKALI